MVPVTGNAGLMVGGEELTYVEGRAIVFDDSFEHSVSNASDEKRVVLVIDVWHPDLGSDAVERLQGTFNPRSPPQVLDEWTHVGVGPLQTSLDGGAKAKPACDYIFKLLSIGNSGVGKTSFILCGADNGFNTPFISTIGAITLCNVRATIFHRKSFDEQGWTSRSTLERLRAR